MADNLRFAVNGAGQDRLERAMEFANVEFSVGYADDNGKRLIFFRYGGDDRMTPFPAPLTMRECAMAAMKWLEFKANYGREPDHDGANRAGWRVYNDAWARIEGYDHHTFMAVSPCWMMYGK